MVNFRLYEVVVESLDGPNSVRYEIATNDSDAAQIALNHFVRRFPERSHVGRCSEIGTSPSRVALQSLRGSLPAVQESFWTTKGARVVFTTDAYDITRVLFEGEVRGSFRSREEAVEFASRTLQAKIEY